MKTSILSPLWLLAFFPGGSIFAFPLAGAEARENESTRQPVVAKIRNAQRLIQQRKLREAHSLLDDIIEALGRGDAWGRKTNSPKPIPTDTTGIIHENAPYELLTVSGEKAKMGIYDPSVEYDKHGRVGWMAYTSVDGGAGRGDLNTHLAKTTDHGRTWRFIQRLTQTVPSKVRHNTRGRIAGVFRHEVPTLVHDPNDPGKEWKLFNHVYFWSAKTLHFPQYGWINYKYASDPAGSWSEDIALFGSDRFPPKPYKTQIHLNKMDPKLKKMFIFTEPASLVKDDTLYLAFTGFKKNKHDNIFLIASDDHGRTWRFVDFLVQTRHAEHFGYLYFDGSALFEQDGRIYFAASPASKESLHNGAFIFEFRNLSKGKLVSDRNGIPRRICWIKGDPAFPSSRAGAGQITYHAANTYGGILLPQRDMRNNPKSFLIFNTKINFEKSAGRGVP